jgi:hypothetical protein
MLARNLVQGICASSLAWIASTALSTAANTHVIFATDDITWFYNGKSSASGSPVPVDDLVVGDVIQIIVPHSENNTHGFVTVTNGARNLDLVLTCGQAEGATPKPLHQTNCEAAGASKFGKDFEGVLQLEVMPTFNSSIDFFCTTHGPGMPGRLSLKQ